MKQKKERELTQEFKDMLIKLIGITLLCMGVYFIYIVRIIMGMELQLSLGLETMTVDAKVKTALLLVSGIGLMITGGVVIYKKI